LDGSAVLVLGEGVSGGEEQCDRPVDDFQGDEYSDRAVVGQLRTGDVIARWGGEEFTLGLPGCDLQQAQTIASCLLRVVPSGQTVSVGLTQARTQDTPRALIERADRALYAAKDGGRNQVKAFQTTPHPESHGISRGPIL
jgi:predicted signal transduction protein with EAL and GGDEF domain